MYMLTEDDRDDLKTMWENLQSFCVDHGPLLLLIAFGLLLIAMHENRRRWLWFVAGIAALGAIAAVVGIWHLPGRMYPRPDDAEARAALQGGLLTAAAALTAVAGGLIALDETRQANAEIRRSNENTHVRELYGTAIGLLSADTVDSRLGGIYALERIAFDSPADRRTVVEVLSAFVREHANPPVPVPPPRRPPAGQRWDRVRYRTRAHGNETLPKLTTDVRAALTVLGRNTFSVEQMLSDGRQTPPISPDLTGVDLSGMNLIGLSLMGANLTGANLSQADLTGAYLGNTDFTNANLEGVKFTGAHLDYATFHAARLNGANFKGCSLDGTVFTDADLSEADLSDTNIYAVHLVNTKLANTTLTNARFHRTNLKLVHNLSQEQVNTTKGDSRTFLPEGFPRPPSWGDTR